MVGIDYTRLFMSDMKHGHVSSTSKMFSSYWSYMWYSGDSYSFVQRFLFRSYGHMAYSSSKMPTKATQKSKYCTEYMAAPVQLNIKQLESKYYTLKFQDSYQGHLRIAKTTAYGSSCPTEKEILHFAIRSQQPKLKRFVHLKPLSF